MKDELVNNTKIAIAHEFCNRLLESPVGGDIAHIVLFGSVAKKTASLESDIDLLIVPVGQEKAVQSVCDDISFDLLLKNQEIVEPLVRCVDKWSEPQSLFLYRIRNSGKELWTMDEDLLRRKEIESLFDLADQYVSGAQHNLDEERFRIATDIGYNAAELYAKCLLMLKMNQLPKSHRGIVMKISEHYVKSGELSEGIGRQLNICLRYRNEARYEPHVLIERQHAEEVIKIAKELRAFCKTHNQ